MPPVEHLSGLASLPYQQMLEWSEKFAKDKHSGLFGLFVSNATLSSRKKKFCNIDI